MRTKSRTSVVVPTFDRAWALGACLAALRRQTLAVEIVVVHDGDANSDAIERVCAQAGAVLVRVPQAGPAAARNAGVGRAAGDYLLFTDDDCEPAPDWAERMTAALDEGAAAVAGGVVNAPGANRFGVATQAIHDHLVSVPGELFATTNNVGCRREVVAAMPFDASFRCAGEDRDWCLRLAQAGIELRRVPGAIVLHRHQLTLHSFVRKHMIYGEGSAQFRRRHARALQPRAWYAKLLRRGFAHGLRTGALVAIAQAAGAFGAARHERRAR